MIARTLHTHPDPDNQVMCLHHHPTSLWCPGPFLSRASPYAMSLVTVHWRIYDTTPAVEISKWIG